MSISTELKTASAILKDWLGSGGKPVSRERANDRAAICIGCPLNSKIKLWERVKSAAADVVIKHLEIKNGMSIRVDNEDSLGMCRVCACVLPLKVNAPLKHILENTDEETINTFKEKANWCWVINEQKEPEQ